MASGRSPVTLPRRNLGEWTGRSSEAKPRRVDGSFSPRRNVGEWTGRSPEAKPQRVDGAWGGVPWCAISSSGWGLGAAQWRPRSARVVTPARRQARNSEPPDRPAFTSRAVRLRSNPAPGRTPSSELPNCPCFARHSASPRKSDRASAGCLAETEARVPSRPSTPARALSPPQAEARRAHHQPDKSSSACPP